MSYSSCSLICKTGIFIIIPILYKSGELLQENHVRQCLARKLTEEMLVKVKQIISTGFIPVLLRFPTGASVTHSSPNNINVSL